MYRTWTWTLHSADWMMHHFLLLAFAAQTVSAQWLNSLQKVDLWWVLVFHPVSHNVAYSACEASTVQYCVVAWGSFTDVRSGYFLSIGNNNQCDCHSVLERDATLPGFGYLVKDLWRIEVKQHFAEWQITKQRHSKWTENEHKATCPSIIVYEAQQTEVRIYIQCWV